MVERYARPRSGRDSFSSGSFGPAEGRRDGWLRMYSWWISCKDTLDRATVTSVHRRLPVADLEFKVTNQDGEEVLTGQATVYQAQPA